MYIIYNGKIRKASCLSFIVCLVSCVCAHLPHTPYVCFNMVFNMVSERAIAGPAPNWVSHLCLWPVHICKNSWHFLQHSKFLQQSEFLPSFRSVLEKEQHSEIGSIQHLFWRWETSSTAHLKVYFFLQSLHFKFFILRSCWIRFILGFWTSFWVFTGNISEFSLEDFWEFWVLLLLGYWIN